MIRPRALNEYLEKLKQDFPYNDWIIAIKAGTPPFLIRFIVIPKNISHQCFDIDHSVLYFKFNFWLEFFFLPHKVKILAHKKVFGTTTRLLEN